MSTSKYKQVIALSHYGLTLREIARRTYTSVSFVKKVLSK